MKTLTSSILILFITFMVTSCNADSYTIETSMGNIKVKLYDNTPLHKANFEKLVEEQFYDSTLFHRVIKDFMVQGGDPMTKPEALKKAINIENYQELIPAEIMKENIHKKGALAAARMGDFSNPERKSSPSQFYIVQGKEFLELELQEFEEILHKEWTPEQKKLYKTIGGAPHLDGDYTVFGEVIEGLDVIDKIAEVSTNDQDKPFENVYIIRIVKN